VVVDPQDLVASAPEAGVEFTAFLGNGDGSFAPGVTSTGLPSQGPLIAARNAKRVYVAGPYTVASFSLAPTGAATLINSVTTAGSGNTNPNDIPFLVIDASGDWLLAAADDAAVIRTYKINQTAGSIGPVQQTLDDGSNYGEPAMCPDNLHLVAPRSYDGDALGVFSFNPATGQVAPTTELAATPFGRPFFVVVADFDIPGFPFGYVVSEDETNSLTIFAGNATGPFVKHSTIAAGEGSTTFSCDRPLSMAASDLDGNGKTDLVVSCLGSETQDHPVVVLMNNGGAVFSAFAM
jgi:hypothetical protein